MMIKKFRKINNAYSYSFFDWDTVNPPTVKASDGTTQSRDTSFVKCNILFGENGNGKSKIVSILKALCENSNSIEKHRDRQAEGQEITVKLDDGSETTFNAAWSADTLRDKLLFFDKHFIDSNVHSLGPEASDTAQRKQQRGRDIIYLGNFAKYNDEIDRVDSIRDLIAKKNEDEFDIPRTQVETLTQNLGITTTEVLERRTSIESANPANIASLKESLSQSQSKLSRVEKANREKVKIAVLRSLQPLSGDFSLELPSKTEERLVLNPTELFGFTVGRGVQVTLHKIEHKKEFIKQGLELVDDSTSDCPFCEQPIRPEKLLQVIQDYQEIFDETFAREEQKVRESLSEYKALLERLREVSTPTANRLAMEDLRAFDDVPTELPDIQITGDDRSILKAELEAINKKERSILEKFESPRLADIQRIMGDTNSKVSAYNDAVAKINGQISTLKKEAEEGTLETRKGNLEGKISALTTDICFAENKPVFESYFKAIDRSDKNKLAIEALERIHKLLKERIVQEFKTFVEEYFTLISRFVKEINPAMDIFHMSGQPSYDERSPSDPAQCGFKVLYNKQDCTSSLSEGEKQVIALAFFFARLSKEADKNRIVVFDDPITSFDTGKRKSTAELIKKETEGYSQVFILTCDPLFKEFCLKQFPDKRKFYYVLKTAGSSAIHYAPNKRETIYSAFEDEFQNLETVLGTNENVVVYGQKLRFCLETKIREEYFGYSEDQLSNMIKKATKLTDSGKPQFEKLLDNKDAILEIYSYCNTGGLAHYPRDGSTSWNELKDKINTYLALEL